MARISTGTHSSGASFRDNSVVPNLGTPESGSAAQSAEAIVERIRNSYVYRKVYEVFASESDPYWLTQLQGILNSVVGASNTWADDLGLSSSSSDKNEAMYNEAINNILSLYNQYQSYKNSLPVNQVQQLSNAGINSAITGNGVNGSSLDQRDIQSGASSLPSTNSGEYISQVANFALNATTGLTGVMSSFADVALKFQDLGLRERTQQFNEDKTFADFKKLMSESGVILNSTSWSELAEKDPDWADNASSRSKALYNAYKEYTDSLTYGPTLIHGVQSGEYDDKFFVGTQQDDGTWDNFGIHSKFGYYGAFLSRDYADLGKMQVDLSIAKAMHSAEVGSSLISEGLTPEDVARAEAREATANSNYNARKTSIFLERLARLSERSAGGDPVASVELINLMQSADWQESAVYLLGELGTDSLQVVGSSLSDISSWNAENFQKCINFVKSLIK